MLTLEVELLTDVYRAALPDGSGAEWPPHPERIFSALVQAWADDGCDLGERAALTWLERQGAPCIEADGEEDWNERSAPTVFVPPNDVRGGEIAVLPDRRPRQARSFRVAVPSDRFVRLHWLDAAPSEPERTALDGLALRVASLGHSASLARFAFSDQAPKMTERLWRPTHNGSLSLRVPHEGRLANLERWYSATPQERPGLGATARYNVPGEEPRPEPVASVFGGPDEWFVFEDVGGFRPDLLACAQVAKRVRDSLMTFLPPPAPEMLSGHMSNGAATTKPHIAVLPLANVGWDHATGDMLGLAVVLPRGMNAKQRDPREERELAQVLKALAAFAGLVGEKIEADLLEEGPCTRLNFGAAGVWKLEHAATPSRASLKPKRWCGEATTWASVTPVLLDRFPDSGDVIGESQLIAAACRNIGLPEPIKIELHKHSAVKGAPSAYPARGDRKRPDWSFPTGAKFASRPRRHVILTFAAPVEGPVVLGAGRFYGLGLCLPVDPGRPR